MKKSKEGKVLEVDRMSNFPDPILHLILSRLEGTEEVIRTSILSRRWRYLWTSIDIISIRKSPNNSNKNQFEEFVCRVLEISSLDLYSFSLSCADDSNMSTVGRWIDASVRRNVKILDMSFSVKDKNDDIELPHCLVTCGSLEVLKLWLFGSRISLPKLTGFPALRVLELDTCKLLNNDLVNDFLKSLTVLEDLSLIDCETFGYNLFSISCRNLKNLRIDNRFIQDSMDMEYGIEGMCNHLEVCCPKLVFLEFFGFMANEINFTSFDSLKKVVIHPHDEYEWSEKGVCDLFAGISHMESLSFHIDLVEEDCYLKNLSISLPYLNTLELTTTIDDTDNMDVLIQILKMFTQSRILSCYH